MLPAAILFQVSICNMKVSLSGRRGYAARVPCCPSIAILISTSALAQFALRLADFISKDGRPTEPHTARMHRSWTLARHACGTLLVLVILFAGMAFLRIQVFGRFQNASMLVPAGRRRGRPQRLDGIFNLDLAGLLELQRAFDLRTFLQRLLQAREHHVKAPGLELDRLAGLDLEAALDRPHLGDALLHDHAVDLEMPGDRGRAADEPVRRAALVADAHIGTRDRRALGRRARPWIADRNRADVVVRREGLACPDRKRGGDDESRACHWIAPCRPVARRRRGSIRETAKASTPERRRSAGKTRAAVTR